MENQVKFIENNDNVSPSWFGITMLFNKKFENKKINTSKVKQIWN